MIFSRLIKKFTELGPIKDFPNHIKILYSYIGNKIFGMYFLSVLASLLETAGIALFVGSIAQSFNDENEQDPFSSTNLIFSHGFIELNLQQTLIISLLIFAIKSMLIYSAYHMSANIRSSLIIDIKNKLVSKYVDIDYETFLKQDIGHMTNLVGEQAYRFNQFYFYLNQFFVAIFTGITFFFAALFVAPKIGLLLLLNMIIVFTLFKALASKVQRISKLVVFENSKITAATLEMLNNMKYVKSTGSDQRFLSRVARSAEKLALYQGLSWKYSGFLIAVKEPILFMSIILIIMIQNILGLTIVSAVTSIILFYRALNYLIVANNSIQTATEFSGSFSQIHRELELRDVKTTKKERKRNTLMTMPKISFHDVTFCYSGLNNKPILNQINFEIIPQKTTVFVGESGNGKTTVLNLITGLLKPTKGKIFYGDFDHTEIDFERLREKVGFVSQESTIFNGTIRDNLLFKVYDKSDPAKLETRLLSLLSRLNFGDFIKGLDYGLSTRVGNNGAKLSGGQRQKILLARELMDQPSLLILDEPISALDAEAQKAVIDALRGYRGEMTIIIITHQSNILEIADTVYRLENGDVHSDENTIRA